MGFGPAALVSWDFYGEAHVALVNKNVGNHSTGNNVLATDRISDIPQGVANLAYG
jgi:hypothetical protein